MTIAIYMYCGHKTTTQQQQSNLPEVLIINIIRFLLMCRYSGNINISGHPFQVAGLLHPWQWQISHQISRCLCHEGRQLRFSTLCNPFRSSWASLKIYNYKKLPYKCTSEQLSFDIDWILTWVCVSLQLE